MRNWLARKAKNKFHRLLFTFKCIYFNFPPYLKQCLWWICDLSRVDPGTVTAGGGHRLSWMEEAATDNGWMDVKHFLIPLTVVLRNTDQLFFYAPRIRKEIGRCAFHFKAPSDWIICLPHVEHLCIFKLSLLTVKHLDPVFNKNKDSAILDCCICTCIWYLY